MANAPKPPTKEQTMSNGNHRDPAKERFWRRLLRHWQARGQSLRVFCLEHDLAEASFDAWERALAPHDGQIPINWGRAGASNSSAPLFLLACRWRPFVPGYVLWLSGTLRCLVWRPFASFGVRSAEEVTQWI
jgi:hypothetical protein